MRGKQFGMNPNVRSKRITPADAGKTCDLKTKEARKKDHPRGCGENILYMAHVRVQRGSPPRMRGKLLAAVATSKVNGITPADAGKTR